MPRLESPYICSIFRNIMESMICVTYEIHGYSIIAPSITHKMQFFVFNTNFWNIWSFHFQKHDFDQVVMDFVSHSNNILPNTLTNWVNVRNLLLRYKDEERFFVVSFLTIVSQKSRRSKKYVLNVDSKSLYDIKLNVQW